MASVAQPVCLHDIAATPELTYPGPLLLGCTEQASHTPWEKLPPHKDEHQVGLDVNRAFVYYPKNGTPTSSRQRHTWLI
jgi:hypothetical protein